MFAVGDRHDTTPLWARKPCLWVKFKWLWVYGVSMEAENGLVAFAETVANQVHDDIAQEVKAGELPTEALTSEYAHKKLVVMHILNGYRSTGNKDELDYDYIEMVARHASENAIPN